MSSLFLNTVNELEKLLLKKKNIAFLIFSCIIPIISALSFSLLKSRLGIFAVNSTNFSILMLSIFTSILLPLFIFSLAVETFSGEFSDQTIKLVLTRPITRFNVYVSKLLSILIFTVINLGIVFIVTNLSGLFLNSTPTTITSMFQGLFAYIISIVPLLFLTVMAIFLAQFFRNNGGALITCIFIYIAAKLIPFLFPIVGRISPVSYTDWYVAWLGSSVAIGRQLNILFLILSYTLILFSAGYYFFDKKDV